MVLKQNLNVLPVRHRKILMKSKLFIFDFLFVETYFIFRNIKLFFIFLLKIIEFDINF